MMTMSFNFRRVTAYLIDIFVVLLISNALSMSPINPYRESRADLTEEYYELATTYEEKLKDIDEEDTEARKALIQEYDDLVDPMIIEMENQSIFEVIFYAVCALLYFGVFAFIMDSQTLGKKLMKLGIETLDDERVPVWKMLMRGFLITELPFTLMRLLFSFILGTNSYIISSQIILYLTFFYEVALIGTALMKKDGRGIHDMILGTKVVDLKPNKKEE